ncbi:MAG TPA: RNA polymerase sigma factor [Prolixibacteraceae bacterium]|nr:RNA polymerase sigma factor [Prolixibacteraceae bacterium]
MTETEFKTNVLPLGRNVYPLARRMLGADGLAQDAIQQSMMKLWESRRQLDHCSNLKAFVFRVVRNVCLDELKKKKPLPVEELGMLSTHSFRFDQSHEQQEMVAIVKQIINSLAENQREVIQLRDIDGLEFDEIAEITAMDIAYIRVLLSRARKTVKEKLEKIYAYETIRKE